MKVLGSHSCFYLVLNSSLFSIFITDVVFCFETGHFRCHYDKLVSYNIVYFLVNLYDENLFNSSFGNMLDEHFLFEKKLICIILISFD